VSRPSHGPLPGDLIANLDGLQPGQCNLLALVAGRMEVILPDPDGRADTAALDARLTPGVAAQVRRLLPATATAQESL
jgi:hypothetical protein